MSDTLVSFPAGAVAGQARVLDVLDLPEGLRGVVVDVTPFHPVDHTWPDQPADVGMIEGVPVLDCLVAATPAGAGPTDWRVGADIDARRGDPEWTWAVVHVLSGSTADQAGILVGADVALAVDADRRRQLSRGHSACHVAALALNQVTASLWTKDPGRHDSLGNPDLDSMAIVESRIEPDGARDEYRIGKSIRRRGLATADLLASLPRLENEANELLAMWTAAGGAARIDTGGDARLVARRTWHADLTAGSVAIPCGGTHVAQIGELAGTRVEYAPTAAGFQVMTAVPPAH